MELTRKQEEGLKIAVERYRLGEKYTCISGYAGTGKSTLVTFIIDALQVDPEDVCYVAFTGKAAMVLQSKGCKNAQTAHKLLYNASLKPDGTYAFFPKPELEHKYKVIVVDEVSMLPRTMWNLLTMHPVYILALGDPGQLPPVHKDEDNHVLDNPHVFLDEIMRQAKESEIIRLSMHVREGKDLSTFPTENKEVMIYPKSALNQGMYQWADQILCGRNDTRYNINRNVRKIKGFPEEPQIGDKIVCNTNHWDFYSNLGNWQLTNGSIGEITKMERRTIQLPYYFYLPPLDYLYVNVDLPDGDRFRNVPVDYKFLLKGEPCLTGAQIAKMKRSRKITIEPPMDFEYGYAITTHKAQGSSWSKILLWNEPFGTREEKTKWLYTAITRAENKLVILI